MKKQPCISKVDRSKVFSIWALYIVASLVFLSGIFLSIISMISGNSLTVLTSQVPGYIFGIVVVFLGLRSLIAVGKLKEEVYKPTSRFRWSNFKRDSK
ncbi:MAG: hypothetical protein VB055_07250 [Oscillospiraceae bacterium]|nr:hypothetical protein [Oscillospiraceae bacterium]